MNGWFVWRNVGKHNTIYHKWHHGILENLEILQIYGKLFSILSGDIVCMISVLVKPPNLTYQSCGVKLGSNKSSCG